MTQEKPYVVVRARYITTAQGVHIETSPTRSNVAKDKDKFDKLYLSAAKLAKEAALDFKQGLELKLTLDK